MTAPVHASGAPMPWELLAAATAGCLVATAFFSGAETGLMSVSRIRLRHAQRRDRDRNAPRLLAIVRNLEEAILTCLIGTNLFNVLTSAVVTAALTARFGERGELYAMIVVSVLVILFAEILPKVLYREFPERLTLASVPPLRLAMLTLAPVRIVMRAYSALWRRILPDAGSDRPSGLDRQRLAYLVAAEGKTSRQDHRFYAMLRRFLQLAHQPVRRLARPLEQLVTVEPTTTLAECLAIAERSGFSRLPVRSRDEDGLDGYYLVRELILASRTAVPDEPPPASMLRSFLHVDANLTPYELFEEFRSQRQQVAVIVGRQGRVRGLLTLEDLLETVIGSIEDEFDARSGWAGEATPPGPGRPENLATD